MSLVIPAKSDYDNKPLLRWQQQCEEHLRLLLNEFEFRHPKGVHFSYFKILRSVGEPSQVAQVWDDNWTLHVQCVWHGDEEGKQKYRLSPEHALISIDIERSQYAAFKAREISGLQREVLARIKPFAERMMNSNITVRGMNGAGHHLIWEPIAFCPDSNDDILRVAERMAIYMKAFYQPAAQAMHDWACQSGATIEIAP